MDFYFFTQTIIEITRKFGTSDHILQKADKISEIKKKAERRSVT